MPAYICVYMSLRFLMTNLMTWSKFCFVYRKIFILFQANQLSVQWFRDCYSFISLIIMHVFPRYLFLHFVPSLPRARSTLFRRSVEQGRRTTDPRRIPHYQTHGFGLPFSSFLPGGNFDWTKAKGSRAEGALVSPLPQLFYPLVLLLAVLHFLQRLAHSLDIGWHLRRLESEGYVRLFLRAFLSNPTRCFFFFCKL